MHSVVAWGGGVEEWRGRSCVYGHNRLDSMHGVGYIPLYIDEKSILVADS